jgi:trehalose 6-phosphate phosphatase
VQLPDPSTAAGRSALAALLAEPARSLVALDVDGTLSPLVADPAAARLAEGALPVLASLADRVGAVALITGREVRFPVETLGLSAVRGLTVLGQYGLQRWSAAEGYASPEPAPGLAVVRAALPELLAAAPDGVTVEDKGLALVVHTRRAPDPQAALDALRPALVALAVAQGLAADDGRYGVELRPRGTDKGHALAELIALHRPAAVLFAGDDRGDLPAVAVLQHQREHGVPGLFVHPETAGEPVPEVRAQADLVVDGPAGTVALLAALVAALGD